MGSPHDGPGTGDGLLPAVPGAPDHRTGLRFDVRDHRRADPGAAAGRAETWEEPPGLQRIRELDRVAAEDRLRGETRGVGPLGLSPTPVDRRRDGILYAAIRDFRAPPRRHQDLRFPWQRRNAPGRRRRSGPPRRRSPTTWR